MLQGLRKLFAASALGLAVIAGTLLVASPSLADKIYFKDGRIVEGKVVREGPDFVIFKIKVGGIEQTQTLDRKDITKVELDNPTPKADAAAPGGDDAKPADAKDAKKEEPAKHTGAMRMVVLNFGPPPEWKEGVEGMVGREISVEAFRRALPLIEKAHADVVVIRVNSGGGMSTEMPKFQDLFEKEYKPRFRTVAWIQNSISAAAMSPWPLEEYYFFPEGRMGACTEFRMDTLKATKGWKLEEVLMRMELASDWGKKDRRIMRAMEIEEPLSVDFGPNGEVLWRQDEQGEMLLNRKGEVFTINANDAMKTRFAKGIAANRDELAKAMNLQEVEWVAQDATDLVDKSLRDNTVGYKKFDTVFEKYSLAVNLAEQLPDKERRGQQISTARRHLAELKQLAGLNPNFPGMKGVSTEWFQEQEEFLKKLAAKP